MPEGNTPIETHASESERMAIFVNEGQYGPFVKAQLETRYRTEDGEWKPTTHYSLNALANHIAYAQWVYNRMREHDAKLKAEAAKTKQADDA